MSTVRDGPPGRRGWRDSFRSVTIARVSDGMRIHVSRDSAVPIRDQLAAQLVYLIGSGQLRAGEVLPSVRALANRLNVHRNTISEAYRDSTLAVLVERGRGKPLRVREGRRPDSIARSDLDALVDATVLTARKRGYTLQQVHERLRDRLVTSPPDHLLIVSDDAGLCVLMAMELRQEVRCPVDVCSPDELEANPARAAGSLVLSTPASLPQVERLMPAEREPVSVLFSSVDEHLATVGRLQHPSLIAVVSVSRYFLEMARALLAPAVGRRHSLREYLLVGRKTERLGSADLVFCDSVTYGLVRTKYDKAIVIRHHVISPACLEEIRSMLTDDPPVRNV
jgi:GntR family transcriptional regulator